MQLWGILLAKISALGQAFSPPPPRQRQCFGMTPHGPALCRCPVMLQPPDVFSDMTRTFFCERHRHLNQVLDARTRSTLSSIRVMNLLNTNDVEQDCWVAWAREQIEKEYAAYQEVRRNVGKRKRDTVQSLSSLEGEIQDLKQKMGFVEEGTTIKELTNKIKEHKKLVVKRPRRSRHEDGGNEGEGDGGHSCPICYGSLHYQGNPSIVLGCSHTFCITCAEKLTRTTCPLCRETVQFGLASYV